MMIPVILCGGSGTRLWPVSRKSLPKPFLPLVSEQTLLQETVLRAKQLSEQPALIVCNEAHRFVVAQQLLELGVEGAHILLEPAGKNTAPAIALAAHYLQYNLGLSDATMLVLPADHALEIDTPLKQAVNLAQCLATSGSLVTFGIRPSFPSTSYGYIETGASLQPGAFQVSRFVEKPNAGVAAELIQSDKYLWNSGMFLMSAATYMQELHQYQPDMAVAAEAVAETAEHDLDFIRFDAEKFAAMPEESIDYAVMEYTKCAAVVPIENAWSDIGTWDAMSALQAVDANGNVQKGSVLLRDTENSYVQADSRLVATLGIQDTIVVETKDAVLVANKKCSQDVQKLVKELKQNAILEATEHHVVCRPWGQFETVAEAFGFKVKQITVNPGATLSMQKHMHRSEHWIVVKGTAEVTCNEDVFLLHENQSTYIPQTAMHRLKNVGKIPLDIIEVQVGHYLGEDDIERFSDAYGRVEATV